ncbi:MAG: hypothetical protein DYH12_15000 [Sorangiineae bacterium PRO1]|nr:hypothetical protein [Sorangiineae bacterium PRO1]
MTALAKAIQERLVELGWQQKTLAHAWYERVGSGSPSTFVTRLSKLMNDEQEGYDFVLDEKEDRLSGLAEPLGWTPEKLRALIDAALARATLILHPQLSEAVSAFLVKRQAPDAYKCVHVEGAGSNGGVREALRDAAKKERNAIVVVPHDGDHDFFDGAGIKTSRVDATKPGYRLVALPDLLRPVDPKLFDDDGMPMVRDEAIERSYRERMSVDPKREPHRHPLDETDPRVRAIRQADAEGRLVTFRLEDVQAEHRWRPWPDALKTRALYDALERVHPEKAKERTKYESWRTNNSFERREEEPWVWANGRSVFVMGPESAAVKAIAQHHELRKVASFEPLVDALAKVMTTLNPDGEGGMLDVSRELEAFETETGIALDIQMADVRKLLAPNGKAKFVDGASVRVSSEADQEVRALLDDVLAREFITLDASDVFVLQAVRDAALVHVVAKEGTLSAVANIGAGRLLRLDTTTFAGEEPRPMRLAERTSDRQRSYNSAFWSYGCTYDGGNVRITLKALFDQNLEGSVLRSVGRRRDEEAARAAAD